MAAVADMPTSVVDRMVAVAASVVAVPVVDSVTVALAAADSIVVAPAVADMPMAVADNMAVAPVAEAVGKR
jgi:hypothetical protein